MEGIIWFILAAIITFALFIGLCKNTRIVSFDGVGGLLNGYLGNFIWCAIFGAGISAFIIYAFESIITSKIFWGIIIAIVVLWFIFSGDSKKERYKEFSKSNLDRIGVRLAPDENGKRALFELYVLPGTVQHGDKGQGLMDVVGFFLEDENNKDSIKEMFYRKLYFGLTDDGSLEWFYIEAYDESKFPIANHKLEEFTRFNENVKKWYTGPNNPKLTLGEERILKIESADTWKINPQGSKVYDIIYREFLKLK